MWYIQTAVDALALPTDGAGRTTLTGETTAWQHLVRDNAFGIDERAAISAVPITWSIWAWQQLGRRVQLHDVIAQHVALVEAVRAEPMRVSALARFPKAGKRLADNVIELIFVVPPDQFARYESLVHFAMTLPSGHISLTVPSPVLTPEFGADTNVHPLMHADSCVLLHSLELVVARGAAQTVSTIDLRNERRSAPRVHTPATLIVDDGDDWLLFAANRSDETPALEDVAQE